MACARNFSVLMYERECVLGREREILFDIFFVLSRWEFYSDWLVA